MLFYVLVEAQEGSSGLACKDRCVWHLLTHPISLGCVTWDYREFLQQNKSQELAVGTCDE